MHQMQFIMHLVQKHNSHPNIPGLNDWMPAPKENAADVAQLGDAIDVGVRGTAHR